MPLAEAVRATGARVQVAVGDPFNGNLPLPTVVGTDLDPTTTDVRELTRGRFPAAVADMRTRWVPAYFGVMHALPAVAALRRAWRDDRPDLVVYDPANPGAAVVADELGIPSMVFSVFHYFPPMLDLPAITRRALDQPDVDPWQPLSQPARLRPYIDPVPNVLQVGPVADHSDVVPIRTVAWEDPLTTPILLPHRTPGRPLVYVTLGTVVGTPELLREAILEAAQIGDVIASVGPTNDPRLLGDLPDNVAVYRFVPTRMVLEAADLVVHHGGMGTTLAAAAFGTPQLLLPQIGDQFANAQAVPHAEIGQALIGPRVDGAIADALATLHTSSGVREATRAVAQSIAAMPGPDQIAEELHSRAGLEA